MLAKIKSFEVAAIANDPTKKFNAWNSLVPSTGLVNTETFTAQYVNKDKIIDVEDPNSDVPEGYVRLTFDATTEGKIDGKQTKVIDVLNNVKHSDKDLQAKIGNIKAIPNDEGMQFKAWNPNVPMDDTVVTTASYTAQYEKITNPNPDPGPGPNPNPDPGPGPGPNPNPDPGPTPGPGQTPGEKPGRPDPSKPGNIDREYGSDRVGTGTRISQRYFDKSKYVILVDSGNYPDALTASVLAKVLDCPILLNNTEYLEENVRKEILRLGADEIIIVGGHNSISEKVREELEPMDRNRVQRIWGDDRFITSAQVAREVAKINGGVTKAVIASCEVFPDALASAPLAGKEVAPILLAKKNSIEKPVRDAFKDLGIGSVYISGGPNTLSPKLEDILPRLIVRFLVKTGMTQLS